METQNPTTNQTVSYEIPEYITNTIQKHIKIGFTNPYRWLLIDLEGEGYEKELFEKIGNQLSVLLRSDTEEYLNRREYSDLVDVIKIYPQKKVFILTTEKHILRHDIYELHNWILSNKEIDEYEGTLRQPEWHHFIAVDWNKPFTYGLSIYSVSLSIEKIQNITKTILSEVMKFYNAETNRIESTDREYTYTMFRKFWYIYNNTPRVKYILERLTDDPDKIERLDNNYYGFTKNNWLILLEFHSKYVRNLLDP